MMRNGYRCIAARSADNGIDIVLSSVYHGFKPEIGRSNISVADREPGMVEAGSRTVCKWTHEGLNKAQASISGRKPALRGRNVIAFLKRMVHETVNEGGTAGITLVLYEDERFLFKRETRKCRREKNT